MYAVRYKYLECVRVFAITRYDAHVRRVHILDLVEVRLRALDKLEMQSRLVSGRLSNFVWVFGGGEF